MAFLQILQSFVVMVEEIIVKTQDDVAGISEPRSNGPQYSKTFRRLLARCNIGRSRSKSRLALIGEEYMESGFLSLDVRLSGRQHAWRIIPRSCKASRQAPYRAETWKPVCSPASQRLHQIHVVPESVREYSVLNPITLGRLPTPTHSDESGGLRGRAVRARNPRCRELVGLEEIQGNQKAILAARRRQ